MRTRDNVLRLDDYRQQEPEPAVVHDEALLIRQANTILLQLDGKPEALAAWVEDGRQIVAGRPATA